MTREEASIIIGNIPINGDECYTIPEYQQAKAMAIKALEQEPYTEAVKRQAVLDTLDKMDKALDDDRTVENYKALLTECYKDLPPVTPKEKTAHWINKTLIYKSEAEDERDCYAGTCSACGGVQECWNYCSGCGARMVSE